MISMRLQQKSLLALSAVLGLTSSISFAADTLPRTASGHPDLSGTFDAATLTPLERPKEFGDNLYMTKDEANQIAKKQAELIAKANKDSKPDRDAPKVGGAPVVGFEDNPEAGEAFGAGNVGGYNWFWVDPGNDAFTIDGKFRTSILVEPKNGRMPPMTKEAQAEMMKLISGFAH
jgi:hypothetical protein